MIASMQNTLGTGNSAGVATGFARAYLNSGENVIAGIVDAPSALVGLVGSLLSNPLGTLNTSLDALRNGYRTAMSDTADGSEARGGLLFGVALTIAMGGLRRVNGANTFGNVNCASPTNGSQQIAKVNSGRSPYSEINGAIGEFQGYDKATNGLGHVGIQAPGKTSVPGRADYVTLDTAGDGMINVWDAKYRAPNNTSYPNLSRMLN